MNSQLVSISKFLSLVLRHRPERIGLALDANGWANMDLLLNKAVQNANRIITREELLRVVASDDKQRYSISEDGLRIRANQGHSVKGIDLQLEPIEPPEELFHGTVAKYLDSIRKQGLRKRQRHHVHLSLDRDTAIKVGQRRGTAVVLLVRTSEMHAAGYRFFLSANGVWLTDHVPAEFLDFPGE